MLQLFLILCLLLVPTDNADAKSKPIKVKISFYTACKKECDSTPNKTAFGCKPVVKRTVAVSRSLKRKLKPKQRIYIEGVGVRHVEDLMSSRVKGDQIDVLVDSRKKAFKLGKTETNIYILKD